MLKISLVDGQRQRRIIVEGALIARWIDELETACEKARTELQGRELVVDVRGLTTISPDGANLLMKLIRNKIKLQSGVYVRELLRQLAHDAHQQPREVQDSINDADWEPDRNAD
jgi:hypothetical protein